MPDPGPPVRVTTCSFCGKSSRDVGKMAEGPGDVFMCVDCTGKAREILDGEIPTWQPIGAQAPPSDWLRHACSFCGRRWAETGALVEGPCDVHACARCVDASLELFRSNGQIPQLRPAGSVDEWNGNPIGSCCSFCGKSGRRVGSMLEGPDNLFLCVNCIDAAAAVVADLRRNGKLPPAKPRSG